MLSKNPSLRAKHALSSLQAYLAQRIIIHVHIIICGKARCALRFTQVHNFWAFCDFSFIYRLELDFYMGKWLGKGGFGHVYEVTSKTDGGSYALKIVQLPDK